MDTWSVNEERDDFGDPTGVKSLSYVTSGIKYDENSGTQSTYEFILDSCIDPIRGFQWKLKARLLSNISGFSFSLDNDLSDVVYKIKIDSGFVFEYKLDSDIYEANDVPFDLCQMLLQYKSLKIAVIARQYSCTIRYGFSISTEGFRDAYIEVMGEKALGIWRVKKEANEFLKSIFGSLAPINMHYSYETNAYCSDHEILRAFIEVDGTNIIDGISITFFFKRLYTNGWFISVHMDSKGRKKVPVFFEIDGNEYVYHVTPNLVPSSFTIKLIGYSDPIDDYILHIRDEQEEPDEYNYEKLPRLSLRRLKESNYTKLRVEYPSLAEDDRDTPFTAELMIDGSILADIIDSYCRALLS